MNTKLIVILTIALMLIGMTLIVLGATFDFSVTEMANLTGLMVGAGAGIVGASIAKLATVKIYKNNPKLEKQKTIDVTDERNTMIRNKAKAKVYDAFNLVFPIVIFGLAVANVSFVLTGTLLAIYGLRTVLLIVLVNKYNKEL